MGLFDLFSGGEKAPKQTAFLSEYGGFHQIAGGSQATMYTAQHAKTGEKRVIKKIIPKDKNARQRLMRELEICLGIKEDHFIRYYGYEQKGEEFYILMEFFEGMSLRVFLRDTIVTKNRRPPFLTGRNFITLFLHAAKSLHAIHQKSYLHLDVKPENFMAKGLELRPTEDTNARLSVDTEIFQQRTLESAAAIQLKLIDFGVSVKEGDEAPLGGSLFYVAPEVVSGSKVGSGGVGQPADIYSLGCTFFELATGSPPVLPSWFEGKPKNWNFYWPEYEKMPRETRAAYEKDMLRDRLSHPADPAKIPGSQAVRDMIMKCLHPSPVKRYPTSFALARDLDSLLTRF